jgi:hypothetical protein
MMGVLSSSSAVSLTSSSSNPSSFSDSTLIGESFPPFPNILLDFLDLVGVGDVDWLLLLE